MADRLRRKLLAWYDAYRRDLPWRATTDPYPVWVSEVMLQQTSVAVVVGYFERWMRSFPDVGSLALADDDAVLRHWQGLGYYSRAKRLRDGARFVVAHGWPKDFDGWRKVPGVGDYTAGAIASICLGLRVPAVDGNVERVYSRLCADPSSSLKPSATDWARVLVAGPRPGDLNQALMELGATVCRPVAPACVLCPVEKDCLARHKEIASTLPTKKTKQAMREITYSALVLRYKGEVALKRFGSGEWWSGLYGFPDVAERGEVVGEFRHTVTRHRVRFVVSTAVAARRSSGYEWMGWEEASALPMPSPHRKALELARSALQPSGS